MKNLFCLLALALVTLPPVSMAATPPDLDALITYESRTTDRNALTRTSRYQEYFVRRAEHVWAERVLPAGADRRPNPNSAVNALGQHDDIDYSAASRHITRNAKGEIELECVDVANTMVVHIPKNSWNMVGFADTWDSSASLIQPSGLAAMKKTSRASPVKGAVWYEEAKDDKYVRILWSPVLQIALRIESGNSQGSEWRSTMVEPKPLTPDAKLPWLQLGKLIQHDYSDFED